MTVKKFRRYKIVLQRLIHPKLISNLQVELQKGTSVRNLLFRRNETRRELGYILFYISILTKQKSIIARFNI